MKNKKLILTTVVFIVMFFAVLLPFGSFVRNNILLRKYADQLYAISLPSNTIKISQDKAVGNLYETGNHLDFVATIEIESLLSESELSDYYSTKAVNIKSVDEISILGLNTFYAETYIDHSVQEIEVIPKAQSQLKYGVFHKKDVEDDSIDMNLFIIQIKDTHYAPGWDLRAH